MIGIIVIMMYLYIYIIYNIFKKYPCYNYFVTEILFCFTLQSIEINIHLIKNIINKCSSNFIFYDHILKLKT